MEETTEGAAKQYPLVHLHLALMSAENQGPKVSFTNFYYGRSL